MGCTSSKSGSPPGNGSTTRSEVRVNKAAPAAKRDARQPTSARGAGAGAGAGGGGAKAAAAGKAPAPLTPRRGGGSAPPSPRARALAKQQAQKQQQQQQEQEQREDTPQRSGSGEEAAASPPPTVDFAALLAQATMAVAEMDEQHKKEIDEPLDETVAARR